jgi:putative multiple sugar transport system substrate-binding protein
MNISRRALLAVAGAVSASSLIGLPAFAASKGKIGIAMPTKSSTRWIHDGESMVAQFKEAGYEADLQYAEDDIPTQLSQIENMITSGVKALIIAAIDGTTLSNALASAHAAGIKVVAYDRLIRQSGDVDFYTTFDNFQVGVLQANSLLAGLSRASSRGTSNCLAVRRTTTTPSSSSMAPCRFSSR